VPELRDVVPAEQVGKVDLAATGWRLVGASRRGRLHAHRAEHREDAFAQAAWRHGWVAAVADGAGSAVLSRLGAELAVRTLVHEAVTRAVAPGADAPGGLLAQAMQAAIARVARVAGHEGVALRDLRCTLLAACCLRDAAGAERLAIAQVGDGFVALADRDGTVRRVGAGDAGEFSGEVSCFVPDDCAPGRATQSVVELPADAVRVVLIASDGVEDPFYPVERTGPALLAQLEQGVREPLPGFQRQDAQAAVLGAGEPAEALLDWLRFEKRGENDDRTLVVAHRTPRPAQP
jgi:hypothetical protein